jgi:hypothetical protein
VGNQMSAIRIEGHFSIGEKAPQTMLFQGLLSFYEQVLRIPAHGAEIRPTHWRGPFLLLGL